MIRLFPFQIDSILFQSSSIPVVIVRANVSKHQDTPTPRRTLSLFDSVCIIVGTIIGSGIFKTAGLVASNAGSVGWMVGFWIGGGVLSLIGAFCFAELTTRFQDRIGGDYVYLKEAYGKPLAFMFAWASFWIIRPGNIGAMAMVFAAYFDQLLPISYLFPGQSSGVVPYTLLAVGALTLLNLLGLRSGKGTQNFLTVAKVLGIGAVVLVGVMFGGALQSAPREAVEVPKFASIWLGMVFVMFSFGGWNDISFVAGEVKKPERNLFRSLLFGIICVTLVYLLLNIAFVAALGFEGLTTSEAIAKDAVQAALGEEHWIGKQAGILISILVCVSCLGAVNGMIITGPRIYYAVGRDYPALRSLSLWSEKRDVPWQATFFQLAITMGLTLLCLGYPDAFEVIVAVVAPYFWSFLGITAFSLILFRLRSGKEQPKEVADDQGGKPVQKGFEIFLTPLFPLESLVMTLVCFGLTYASISYAISRNFLVPSLIVGAVMLFGVYLGFGGLKTDKAK